MKISEAEVAGNDWNRQLAKRSKLKTQNRTPFAQDLGCSVRVSEEEGYSSPYPPPGYPSAPPPPSYEGYPPPPTGYPAYPPQPPRQPYDGYQGYFAEGYPPPPPPQPHPQYQHYHHYDHYHYQNQSDSGCFSFLQGWMSYFIYISGSAMLRCYCLGGGRNAANNEFYPAFMVVVTVL
ncbi:hypothetical protein J1N35_038688 [Gossypium stocksii]|uniref:Rhodopsin n=1 Tax=Gossypium stocksii TaxID=47602 RepID=A0A9D3UN76_9ROSI|nr:hypothetical protein J1N35_038688 [Gossypium stocksii]